MPTFRKGGHYSFTFIKISQRTICAEMEADTGLEENKETN